ncbi:MAG: hypothetical protein M1821_001191 [Bathelium mastoideum]|nr:MAG: hypothetical protein M1821_001191 [Bathelium mastoideum]
MPYQQTTWEKTKTTSKAGFDKVWGWADKLGAPVNKLSNKLGSEAFWPTTLDKESDKAARILRSFCKDGFYDVELTKSNDGPKQKQRVLKKIPPEVIRNAKGLAIFTTMRTGLWVSGAGGSGVLLGRKEDGSWSPPSGILLHTAGVGFLVGVDIYDCVIVINTQQALDAFSKLRCTVGGEISAVAGPVGAGGILETEVHKRQAPVFTYLKSRGFYAGVQIDGSVIIERTDENERFYLQRLSCSDILAGKVRHPPYELRTLMETLKAAEGDSFNESLLPSEPPPGDYEVREEQGGHVFGIPDKDDPDPFGVKALQEAGMEIREATTRARASADDFEFKPSPTSPIFSAFNRRSMDSKSNHSLSRRSSWRTSTFSNEPSRNPTSDSATQTEFGDDAAPSKSESPRRSPHRHSRQPSLGDIHEDKPTTVTSPPTTESLEPIRSPSPAILTNGSTQHTDTPPAIDEVDDEPVIQEAKAASPATASPQRITKPQLLTKARLVTVPPRGAPPALPPRNPGRGSRKGPLVINADPAEGESGSPVSLSSPVSFSRRSMERDSTSERRKGSEASEEVAAAATTAAAETEVSQETDSDSRDSRVDSANGEGEMEKQRDGAINVKEAGRASPTMPGAFEDVALGEKEDFS